MVLVYADTAALATWSGQPVPAGADQLLRSASMLVRRATRTAVYEVHPSGLPSDSDVAQAMRDATCAQAAHWSTNGIDPAAGAAGASSVPVPQSSPIGGASVTYGAAANAGDLRVAAVTDLCAEAADVLDQAGLLGGHPWVVG